MNTQIESGLWVLFSLLAQPLAKLLWPKLRDKVGEWGGAFEAISPWLHAVAPLYLSLMTGAVLGSQLGIYGFGLEGSLLGVLAGVLIMAGLYLVRRFQADRLELPAPPSYPSALRDELRWAFYRGAAGSWLGLVWLNGLVGMALAVVEWMLADQAWKGSVWREPDRWASLIRAGISSGIYALSGNLWLVLAVQILTLLVWRLKLPQIDRGEGETA